jgi:hypothetical protein
MSDKPVLRDLAQRVLRTGTLPARRPDGMWGGPGTGRECTICGDPVKPDETEFEAEFIDAAENRASLYHLHVHCFAAWDAERQAFQPREDALPLPRADTSRTLTGNGPDDMMSSRGLRTTER